jgi:ABC-type dipeptide/oligopeptide/nickel transport system permease component
MAKKNKYENLTEEEIVEIMHQKKKKRQSIFDKITTGILIFLMASPVLILGYIFLWFILNLKK